MKYNSELDWLGKRSSLLFDGMLVCAILELLSSSHL
jgi:hypothetical protein